MRRRTFFSYKIQTIFSSSKLDIVDIFYGKYELVNNLKNKNLAMAQKQLSGGVL